MGNLQENWKNSKRLVAKIGKIDEIEENWIKLI